MHRISVTYDDTHIPDVSAEARRVVRDGLTRIDPPGARPLDGRRIAVAVGSRGIANIAAIVAAAVAELRSAGADPFIVPAMGSHGGATAAGQAAVLADYGVTEAGVGAPVRSSMETVEIPSVQERVGNRAFMDRLAWESDGVLLINRVKAHTDFRSQYESGLAKLCVIGLGKHDGALEIHSFGVRGLRERIAPTAEAILATGKVIGGVAIVENAYDRTMGLHFLRADEIMAQEPTLLREAMSRMPRLPFDEADVLVIDRMGKDLSGSGIDPNIIGRIRILGQEEPTRPHIGAIVVTDLTPASHGNAVGVGLADVITERLRARIDYEATNENVVTSSFLERGKTPLVAATDARAVEIAIRGAAVRGRTGRPPRIARIPSTLHINEIDVSAELLETVSRVPNVTVSKQPRMLLAGDLLTPWS